MHFLHLAYATSMARQLRSECGKPLRWHASRFEFTDHRGPHGADRTEHRRVLASAAVRGRAEADPGDRYPGAGAAAHRSDAGRPGEGMEDCSVHLRLPRFAARWLRPRVAEPAQAAR